jgi:hypothetical protein
LKKKGVIGLAVGFVWWSLERLARRSQRPEVAGFHCSLGNLDKIRNDAGLNAEKKKRKEKDGNLGSGSSCFRPMSQEPTNAVSLDWSSFKV